MKLFENYLQNRIENIGISEKSSRQKLSHCSIAHESVLELFLFLLFIKWYYHYLLWKQSNNIRSWHYGYQCWKEIDSLFREYNIKITNWLDSNKLTINAYKCEVIHFGRGRPDIIVRKEQTLDYKSTCRNFRFHIDPQLSFKDHLNLVVKN